MVKGIEESHGRVSVRTATDHGGAAVGVRRGLVGVDGRRFLLLKREEPYMRRSALFLGEITLDRIEKRVSDSDLDPAGGPDMSGSSAFQRLLVYDEVMLPDLTWLSDVPLGVRHLPLFGRGSLKAVVGGKVEVVSSAACAGWIEGRQYKFVRVDGAEDQR